MALYRLCELPFETLNRAQAERLHDAIMRVLSQTGVVVESAEARDLLHSAGGRVHTEKSRVTLAEKCVLAAIETAPKVIRLYGQDAKYDVELGGKNVYTLGGAAAVTTHHLDGSFRPSTLQDLIQFNRFQDALEHLDVLHGIVDPTDIPEEFAPRLYNIVAATNFATTYKPCALQVDNRLGGVRDLFQMAVIVRGSEEEARRRPLFTIHDSNARPPFALQEENARVIMEAAKLGIPGGLTVWPMIGMTAPVTIMGALAVKYSLYFAGLVLAQTVNPGCPFIFPVGCGALDMKYGNVVTGSPEILLAQLAGLSLARYYGLPSVAVAATDAKGPDVQAAYEKMAHLLTLSLAGANLIHGTTSEMDGMMVASFQQCVIDDEIAGYVRRLLQGFSMEEEEFAFAAIEELMNTPGEGDFLCHPHTLARFRTHLWEPVISCRQATAQWREEGAKRVEEAARARAKEILERHDPRPLAPRVERELMEFAYGGRPPAGRVPHAEIME